jgi:hypothetical protein
MTYDNEAIVRHAYHTAEGSVLDVAGFVGGFAKDGVINLGHAAVALMKSITTTLSSIMKVTLTCTPSQSAHVLQLTPT